MATKNHSRLPIPVKTSSVLINFDQMKNVRKSGKDKMTLPFLHPSNKVTVMLKEDADD